MKIKYALLAGLMTIAMAGVSHAGEITHAGATEHLYDSLFYVQFSRHGMGPVDHQICPITPGDRAKLEDTFKDKIKLTITSGRYKGCQGWTWKKNYAE